MFHSLRGTVVAVGAQRIVLSTVYGIEWSLACSSEAIAYWQRSDGEQVVYTHLIPREDALNLYGYYSEAERQLFLQLIKVNGIGAAVALNALSTMSVSVVWQAIEQGNHQALSKIPKIGNKSAQKIVISLRGSVARGRIDTGAGVGAGAALGDDAVVESLLAMGYERGRVLAVVADLRGSLSMGGAGGDSDGGADGEAAADATRADGDETSIRNYEDLLFKEALKRLV